MSAAAPLAHLHRAAFVQIPLELLVASAERKGTVFVYAWLWHHAGRQDTAFPSVDTLAEECRMKADDVRRALRYLVDEGWITRHDRPGATTLFHVRMEAVRPPGPPATAPATPPPNGGPHPSPKWGTPPLPQMGETNKNQLTRTREQEKPSPQPSLREGPPPQGAPCASGGIDAQLIPVADRQSDPPPPRKRRSSTTKQPAEIPAYVESVRPLLEAWWRLRRKRHRADPQTLLTSRSLNALAYAHELGVLEAFAELAAESGWLSLGFNGHRDYIAKLAAERTLNDCANHPNSCMVSAQRGRTAPRATTRQADAAERAIAMFSVSPEPPAATCSPPLTSSLPWQA